MPKLKKTKRKPKGATEATTANFWAISYYCRHCGKSHVISSGARQRKVAESKLARFTLMLERDEVVCGVNPFLERRVNKPVRLLVADLLQTFEADLRAGRVRRGQRKAVSLEYANLALSRLRRVLDAVGAGHVDELSTDSVNKALDNLQVTGTIATLQTRRHHESILRTFGKWLVSTERLDRDPFRGLKLTFVGEGDTVHDRTAFTLEQLQRVVDATRSAPTRGGLTGQQRAMLYIVAAYTGLRARECGAIRKRDFTPDFARVVVAGSFTKNGKEAVQPVPLFLRPLVGDFIANLSAQDFLFPGGWHMISGKWQPTGWVTSKLVGKALRQDAATIGIVIGRKGKEQNGAVLDFHSLRHFYGTIIDQAGISDGLRRKLHRASTQELLDRYTHRELAELTAAVEELPAISWAM